MNYKFFFMKFEDKKLLFFNIYLKMYYYRKKIMWKKLIFLVLIDQGSKLLITHKFDNLLVKNFGSAFSLPIPKEILILIAFGMIAWVIWSYYENLLEEKFSILILAGAIGNLIDRIYFGYVIDFINLKIWPVFNIADIYITFAIFLLIKEELTKKYG